MDLFVFSTSGPDVARLVGGGAAGAVIDWERRGKARRQLGEDTQINHDTPRDLRAVRAATTARVVCRINPVGRWTAGEVRRAVALGADEVLVPMLRRPDEVAHVVDLAAGRCGVAAMVETQDAVEAVDALVARPLARVYVGLNDLRIDRGARAGLFEPMVDGTVEHVRARVAAAGHPFGVAGLTRPDAGHPVPSALLMAEMDRLGVDFTFLRRSFHADTADRDPAAEIGRIHAALALASTRDARRRAEDRAAFARAIAAAAPVGLPAPVPV
ncbi:aldolase/citrate lyase family protein [Actinomycetospora straminea]|uniref:HpcH/HpaI aldolase/citrate lyase domain-containing protein n=1 Tax=Actinomycetospora straminea TaxID=663607 RepID=A0ABP9E6F1_9PSEU|nr:aldolase/citrate lyase family protein [Actinomycetospora straminea]MDD7932730.1 aldolase/citrate lyase family protein [Actinomycetospora straminea]